MATTINISGNSNDTNIVLGSPGASIIDNVINPNSGLDLSGAIVGPAGSEFSCLTQQLELQLPSAKNIKLTAYETDSELIAAWGELKINFTYLGASKYATLYNSDPTSILPVARQDGEYYSIVISKTYTSLSEAAAAGAKIGMSAGDSTSGNLIPNQEIPIDLGTETIADSGLVVTPLDSAFGGHWAVINALIDGTIDIGVIWSQTPTIPSQTSDYTGALEFPYIYSDYWSPTGAWDAALGWSEYSVIWYSKPIVEGPIVVNPNLLHASLIALLGPDFWNSFVTNHPDCARLSLGTTKTFVAATHSDYSTIVEIERN